MRADQVYDSANCGAAAPYTIEVISTDDELLSLETDWNRLSETSSHPNAFMTYGWFRAWSNQIAKEDPRAQPRPYVLVLKAGGLVVGISPLIRRIASRLFSVRKLEFSTIHADYNDVVLGGNPAGQIKAVADFLAETAGQWDVADLRDLRDTGEGTALIEGTLKRAGLLYQIFPDQEICPHLRIIGDAAEIIKRRSRHVRHFLRNQSARAAAQGLRTRIIENPENEPNLLKTLVELDRLKHLHQSTPAFVSAYPEVFQPLFDTLGPRGWLFVALLEQGDRPVAFQMGFRCGVKLWDYTKAYDRSFFRLSPGTLLLQAVLTYGFARGFSEYDFLRGDEQYKKEWSTGCRRQFRVLIWNRRWRSQVRKFFYYDVKTTIRRLLRKSTDRPESPLPAPL
jgi:CelD/BcsL family acetyltransferase involved in cellulose biosynthesis